MDSTVVTQTLWAATRGLEAKEEVAVLSRLRDELAAMLRAGFTNGFPQPEAPTATERLSGDWVECAQAATAQKVLTAANFALLAPIQAGVVPERPPATSGLSWPMAAGSVPVRSVGPVRDTSGREFALYLYSTIDETVALQKDGSARPGFYGGEAVAPAVGASSTLSRRAPEPWARRWSWILLFIALGLATLAVVRIYATASMARNAAEEMILGTKWPDNSPPPESTDRNRDGRLVLDAKNAIALTNTDTQEPDQQPAVARLGLSKGETPVVAGTQDCLAKVRAAASERPQDAAAACDHAWAIAWANQQGTRTEIWRRWLLADWRALDGGGRLSVLLPFLLTAGAVTALGFAAGVALQGYMFGALIDERKRLSLSRMQMMAWTFLLLGGYVVLSLFNIALGSNFLRELGQRAALASAAPDVTATGPIVQLFPSMDVALWGVLGVTTVVSPYIAKVLLNRKDAEFGTVEARENPPDIIAPLDKRNRPSDARWSDLVSGEEKNNADQVDISRLQHVVITGLLLAGYSVLLVDYAQRIDAWSILTAYMAGVPVFAAMPPVDGTFLGLLVLSHGGYLAFKSLPGGNSGGPKG